MSKEELVLNTEILPEDNPLLTMEEAGNWLRLSDSELLHLVRTGELIGHQVGQSWRFYLEDLRACIKQGSSERKPSGQKTEIHPQGKSFIFEQFCGEEFGFQARKGFADWLKEQKDEKTDIGEFARKMLQYQSFPGWSNSKTVYVSYLKENGHAEEIQKAFNVVWEAYTLYRKMSYRNQMICLPIELCTLLQERAKQNDRLFSHEVIFLLLHALQDKEKAEG